MKINKKKILDSKNEELLDLLGFKVNILPVLGKIVIETFENEISKPVSQIPEKEGFFRFETHWTGGTGEIFQFAIFLSKRLLFVFHAGEWKNIYSSDKCNWGTGEGTVKNPDTYKTLWECIQNRNYELGIPIEKKSAFQKILDFAKLNENIKEIEKELKKMDENGGLAQKQN